MMDDVCEMSATVPVQQPAVIYQDIERLCAPESAGGAGLTANDINRLREHGFTTVESIAFTPMRKLVGTIKSIGEVRAERMKAAATRLIPMGFNTATAYLKLREEMIKITTGSSGIDAILRGGIETGSITEIIGEFKAGKTQFCHTLCITAQLPVSLGGAAGKVVYIDTEGTFRPERIVEIAERYNMNPEIALGNIVVARAYNSDHQISLLTEAANVMASGARFAMIIVDSATGLFRSDYSGRGELADRQQNLSKFLRLLQRISDEFGAAVVITNQVIANVDTGSFMPGPTSKPAGGHVMAHACQTRLMLRKGAGDKRICKVFDSPNLPETEAIFFLARGGIAEESTKKKLGESDSD
jgi:DNA repair protein RAD51